jgi:DNA invertase Pin-like site-specific DNA recombinase
MNQSIAYIRVSSREQGRSGFGLAVQTAQLDAYAQASGSRVVQFYKDVASAIGGDTLKDRPGLQGALDHARQLGCPLLIVALDRLSRDTREIERLVFDSGVETVVVQESPDRVIDLRVRAARVKKETELLKERVKRGVQRARDRGVVFGNRKNLTEAQKKGAQANRDAAILLQREVAKTISGIPGNQNMSGSEIARQLNQLGYRTSRGKEWTDQNLRRLLRAIDRGSQTPSDEKSNYSKDPRFGSWA